MIIIQALIHIQNYTGAYIIMDCLFCVAKQLYKQIRFFKQQIYYRIMQIVRGGKLSRLHALLVIRGKTFAIA